jgi:formylmethanofuran dehydrogenase subunit A
MVNEVRRAKTVEEFIEKFGVSRCPTAAVAHTTGTISPEDVKALEDHAVEMRASIKTWFRRYTSMEAQSAAPVPSCG